MTKTSKSNVVPGLRLTGTLVDTKEQVWVEVPSLSDMAALEERIGHAFGTNAVFPGILHLALIEWSAKHGAPEQVALEPFFDGYKLPIPVVRRLEGGNLQLLEGAGAALALKKVEPRSDGKFTVLVALA